MIYVDEQEPVGGEHLIAVDGLVRIDHFWGNLVISSFKLCCWSALTITFYFYVVITTLKS